MVGELAGDQWNEGDVSCSVVRRVALPDAFFAADGLFETFLTVLDDFGAYPAVIERELDRYLPFLATTKVLMAAVRAGVGRERPTRPSRSTPSPWRSPCARRGAPTTTCSTAWPPTPASPRPPASPPLLADPLVLRRRGPTRWPPSPPGRGGGGPATPRRPPYRPEPIL
jgi:adenylosuccinate lyase